MKIEKGTSRIAVVGEHVTLKFPQIHGTVAFKYLIKAIRTGKLRRYLTGSEKLASLRGQLLRGWLENWREWRLSKEITETIVPTRFSIFGIVNLQDTAPDADLRYGEVYNALRAIIDEDLVYEHGGHTMPGTSNFGVHDGKLKIRDYGELGLDVLLKEYGAQLKQALDETMAKIQAR